MAARLIAAACILLGALLYWAALGSSNPKAYMFPQALALTMAALGVAMLISELRGAGKAEAVVRAVPWSRLWPGMLVLVVYMALAERIGFYVSAWLAFLSIAILYAPAVDRLATAKRSVPISIAFLAVLYLVFWTLLQVQLPSGLTF
jgi:predicted neutral ceramidase superfamily lipid hydrolase